MAEVADSTESLTARPGEPAVEYLPKLTPVEETFCSRLKSRRRWTSSKRRYRMRSTISRIFHRIEIQLDSKGAGRRRHGHRYASLGKLQRYFTSSCLADPAGIARPDVRHSRRGACRLTSKEVGEPRAYHANLSDRRPARGQGLRQPDRGDHHGRFQILGRIRRPGQHLRK